MDSSQVLIIIMIGALGLSIIMVMPKFFRFLGMMILNAGFGLVGIYLINLVVPEQIQVGLNFLSGTVVSLLGLPGVGLLYGIQLLI